MKYRFLQWGCSAVILLAGMIGCGGSNAEDQSGTCWSAEGCSSYFRDLCLAQEGHSFGQQSCADLGYTELCGALNVKPGDPCLGDPNPNPDPGMCLDANETCATNSDCCVSHLCVDFGNAIICAHECTTASQCVSGCCISLEGGGGACGAASFCETNGTCPSNNCTETPYTGSRYMCVNGSCVCKPHCQPFGSSVCCGGSLCAGDCIGNPCCT